MSKHAKNYGYDYEYGYNYGYGYGYGNYGYGYGNYVGARSSAVVSAKPKEMTEEEKALFKAMAAARSKVYTSYEEAIADENPKVDSFFPSPTGWMCLQRRKIDDNELIFIKKADKCPLIDAVDPRIEITVNNKIPKELLVEIVGSFARICQLNGNEAAAQIYREKEPAEGSTEKKYVIYYPEQTISGAQVTYANDVGMLEMRKTHELIMELHSHNRMQAFWSGTDNANEKDCGFYMVIGTFGSAAATYKCRVKYGDLYTDFPAHNIFDMTPEEEVELLKRENWTEGNPIIEQKAKAHSVSYNYNTTPRTVTQFGKTTGFNSGALPETLLTKYNEHLGKIIPNKDPLSTQLMRMQAFWSGTDNANEKDCGFYMVIGTFGSAAATYKCRVKYGDLYTDFPAHNIFDMTPEEEVELLKRENWTEGNPIIEQKAKAHSVSYNYNTTPRTVTQFGKTTGFNSGALPETLLTKYNEHLGKIIPNKDPLSTQLMRYSKYDTVYGGYVCNSHAYSPSKFNDRNWHPIDANADPLMVEADKYISKLEESYSKESCLRDKPVTYDYAYNNSGAAAVNYLIGNANDLDAKRVNLPGNSVGYSGADLQAYKPGINDDALRDAVNNMAVGRICAAENIQQAVESVTGESAVTEFNEDFRKNIAMKLDGLTANVKPALLWELFTNVEKVKLSNVFSETIADLGKQFTALQNVVPEFILFVFWATLVPDNYRLRLMNAVDVVREVLVEERKPDDAEVNIVQGINDLLGVNKDLFVDIVGVKSKVEEDKEGEQQHETSVSDQN